MDQLQDNLWRDVQEHPDDVILQQLGQWMLKQSEQSVVFRCPVTQDEAMDEGHGLYPCFPLLPSAGGVDETASWDARRRSIWNCHVTVSHSQSCHRPCICMFPWKCL